MNVYLCTLTFTPMMQAKKKGEKATMQLTD